MELFLVDKAQRLDHVNLGPYEGSEIKRLCFASGS